MSPVGSSVTLDRCISYWYRDQYLIILGSFLLMPSKGKLRPREIKLQARVSQPIHGRNGVKKKNTIQPLERLNWKGSSVIFKNDFALSSPGQRRILKNRDVTGTRSWVQKPKTSFLLCKIMSLCQLPHPFSRPPAGPQNSSASKLQPLVTAWLH